MSARQADNLAADSALRITRLCWQDWLLAFLMALFCLGSAWSPLHLSPIGTPPDEWAHLSYLSEVALDGHLLPDYANSRILPAKIRANYLGHPPLYYTSLGLVGRMLGLDPVKQLTQYRIMSASLVSLGILLWFLTGRLLAIQPLVLVACTAMTCAIPMFPYLAGSINNDALAYLSVAVAIYGIARVPTWPRLAYYVGAAGLACALLSKLTAGLFLLLLFLFWLVPTFRRPDFPLRNRHFVVAASLLVVACAAYYLPTIFRYGVLMPAAGNLYSALPPPGDPVGIFGVAKQFVVTMVGYLPFVASHDSLAPLAGPLSRLFLLALLLPIIAYAATWRIGRDAPVHALRGSFLLALATTVLVHFIVVLDNYNAHGNFSGLQPRYYAYAIPGIFILCFAHTGSRRTAKIAFAMFALSAAVLLSIAPALLAQAQMRSLLMREVKPIHLSAQHSKNILWPTAANTQAGRIDTIRRSGTNLEVSGWAIDSVHRQAAGKVWVFVGDKAIGSIPTGYPRPDVARALGSFNAGASGFHAVIQDVSRSRDECEVHLAAEQQDGALEPLGNSACPSKDVP